MESIITIAKGQAVQNPIAIVPMIAIGMARSGEPTSSARCVAQSRHENGQFVLIRPRMKAIPFSFQPVLLMNVVKTYFAVLRVGAAVGTAMMIVVKDAIEMYNVDVVILGRILPYTLKRKATTLKIS